MKLQRKYVLWLVLSLPAMGFLIGLINGKASPQDFLHPSGEFSARFMIIAMLASPLLILFRRFSWSLKLPQWLMRNRRAFGVAAFAYALFHTVLYLIDKGSMTKILSEITQLGIWTGWLAFVIFIPLALTSNDRSVRVMKSAWKKLQRWVYPAAVLTLLHWLFVQNNLGPALVHFVPLALLELFRLYNHQTAGNVMSPSGPAAQ